MAEGCPSRERGRLALGCPATPVSTGPALPGLPRWRANFTRFDGEVVGVPTIPLFRPPYGGSASTWGFAVYLARPRWLRGVGAPKRLARGYPREEALACGSGCTSPTRVSDGAGETEEVRRRQAAGAGLLPASSAAVRANRSFRSSLVNLQSKALAEAW